MASSSSSDVLIIGGGIIGLALALELNGRGARVTVLERDSALAHASQAAAGMLAVRDPHNPAALAPLSLLSEHLYPGFLQRIRNLSGQQVPIHTEVTWQYAPGASPVRLNEQSLDPRQLASALLAAVRATSINLREHATLRTLHAAEGNLLAEDAQGANLRSKHVVLTAGAWTSLLGLPGTAMPITPVKGQMLRVQVPEGLHLTEVHRDEQVYVVPRLYGPQAGTALIGATVESVGFDTSIDQAALDALRRRAARLVPGLASGQAAPILEAWAGLRPATQDRLPVLGETSLPGVFLATGHFRNGILLAPATAQVMADWIDGTQPSVNCRPFSPERFMPTAANGCCD